MSSFLCRTVLVLSLFVASPAYADAAADVPKDASAEAIAFVEPFSDAHLTGILQRLGARQPTLVALSQLHGQMLAAVYEAEVDKAVEEHGAEWRRNLARSWTGLMTDEELASLREDGADSPHSAKYRELSGQAGQRMQVISEDLLRKIMAEVVQNTIDSLAEPAAEDTGGTKDGTGAATD